MAAAIVAVVAGSALAQCKLDVTATPKVIMPGQAAKIDVQARFPVGAHAFAASDFGVSAGTPSWSFVTDGLIAGADVVGISASQPHAPQLGILADPANPYSAWTGKFTPASYAPAYIEIKATPNSPSDFWYYPSALTSSAAQCQVRGGETGVFVNPVRLGKFAAAPGVGGTIRTSDGSFVATGVQDETTLALLLPWVSPAREASRRSSATVQTSRVPTSLAFNGSVTGTASGGDRPMESLSLNYTKITYQQIEYDRQQSYELNIDPMGADSVAVAIIMPDGQEVPVELRDGRAPFRVQNLPLVAVTDMIIDPRAGCVSLGWHFSAGPSARHPGGINLLWTSWHNLTDSETLRTLGNLGIVHAMRGEPEKAEACWRECLERRRIMGNALSESVVTMGNLGVLLQDQGRFAEARDLLEQALAAERQRRGDRSPATLTSMSQLASLLLDAGDLEASERLARECWEGRRTALRPDHPDTLYSQTILAVVLHRRGDSVAGWALMEPALAKTREVVRPGHPQVLSAIGMAAEVALGVARQSGQFAHALALSTEALNLSRQAGPDDPSTGAFVSQHGAVLLAIAASHAAQDEAEWNQAKTGLVNGYQLLERGVGPHHPQAREAAGCLAEYYTLMNRRSPGLGFDRDAATWRAKASQDPPANPRGELPRSGGRHPRPNQEVTAA
jgi:hypothetical protein